MKLLIVHRMKDCNFESHLLEIYAYTNRHFFKLFAIKIETFQKK